MSATCCTLRPLWPATPLLSSAPSALAIGGAASVPAPSVAVAVGAAGAVVVAPPAVAPPVPAAASPPAVPPLPPPRVPLPRPLCPPRRLPPPPSAAGGEGACWHAAAARAAVRILEMRSRNTPSRWGQLAWACVHASRRSCVVGSRYVPLRVHSSGPNGCCTTRVVRRHWTAPSHTLSPTVARYVWIV